MILENKIAKLIDVLIEKGICAREDKDILVYGLYLGIELLLNTVTTIILGVLFNLLLESFIFVMSYSLIRVYAGGYHCKKSICCYFFSSGIVVFVLILVKFTPIWHMLTISLIILLISMPIVLKLAPMEGGSRSLDKAEKKYFRKKTVLHFCLEFIFVIILFLFNLHILGYVVSLGVFITALLILLELFRNIKV